MIVGERLRSVREQKDLSQGDVEKRSGLLRCYVSRVENGHTVPAVETLEKFARALEVPLYMLVYVGSGPVTPIARPNQNGNGKHWGSGRSESRQLQKLISQLAKMRESDRGLLMAMAVRAARRGSSRK